MKVPLCDENSRAGRLGVTAVYMKRAGTLMMGIRRKETGMRCARWVIGLVGVLVCVESPPAICASPACSGATPTAETTVPASVAFLRTTHDEINLVKRDGVVGNDLAPFYSDVTVGGGTTVKMLMGDTLAHRGEVPLLGLVVGASPPVRLDGGALVEFVTRQDGALSQISLTAMVQTMASSIRRGGCASDSISASPVVHLYRHATDLFKAQNTDDLVYVGTHYDALGVGCAGSSTQNKVVALRASDHAVVWQFNGDGLTSVDGIVGMALDRSWQTNDLGGSRLTTILQNDILFVTTERTASVAQQSVWAIDVLTGQPRWSVNAGRMTTSPVISPLRADRIYVVNRSGELLALSKSDGTVIWSFVDSGIVPQKLVVNHDGPEQRIAVVDAFGRVKMIRDNDTTAEALWTAELPIGPIVPGPISSPGVRALSGVMDDSAHLYIGATDGKIYQLDADTGEILATRTVDEDQTTPIEHLELFAPATDLEPAQLIAGSSEGHIAKFCMPFCKASECAAGPTAADDGFGATEDTPLMVAVPGVLANDTTASGTSLSATLITDATHGTVSLTPDGAFVYTPVADYSGPDSFSYTASDGTLDSNVATVSIEVEAVNDPPVAVDAAVKMTEGTVATGTLVASDIDGPALTFAIVANGTKGVATVTDPATGAFTYTPHPDATGIDAFTFSASDGLLTSNSATISVSILPPHTLTVSSPNGGETIAGGTAHAITWAYSGNPGPRVRIELLENNILNSVIAARTPIGSGGMGSFTWTVPRSLPGGTAYTIRVTSTTLAGVGDTSDSPFGIVAPTITVIAPDGGNVWSRVTPQTIQWRYTGDPGGSVRIELLKNGAVERLVAANAPIGTSGLGSFIWAIPVRVRNGTDYAIRITSREVAIITDVSSASFSIGP